MSKPCGRKSAAPSPVCTVLNSRPPANLWLGGLWLKRGIMKAGICWAFAAGFVVMVAMPAYAASRCPADVAQSLELARAALARHDGQASPDTDRHAMHCLVEAMTAINARLEDIVAGRVVLDRVTSKKGYYSSDKPSTSEAR